MMLFSKVQQVINCSPSVQIPAGLFYLFIYLFFLPFSKTSLSPSSSFLFKIPSFYNTLHRSVTWPPVPYDLHSLYTDSSGCDNLNSPSLYNNFTSNLPCPTKIWTACHLITRFVVALMDVGLWWRKAILKASRLLPAPWTGHATTIMVFSLLIYSDHPRNPDHHQISHEISIVPLGPPHKVSSISVHNYLSNIA